MTAVETRILIVDDDVEYAGVIAAFLEAHGFSVLQAHTGDEGVRLANAHGPSLILMDIMMNERAEGFRAIHEIRRNPELKRVPIFVISAFCTQLQDLEIPEDGWMEHDAFLSKPVDTQHLLEKVRRWVGIAV